MANALDLRDTAPYPVNSLLQKLWSAHRQDPSAPALRFITGLDDDQVDSWTWHQFLIGIADTVTHLRDIGVQPGDSVLMVLSAGPQYLCTFWGLITIGAHPVSVPVTPEMPVAASLATIRHIARDCGARYIALTEEKAAEWTAALPAEDELAALTPLTYVPVKSDSAVTTKTEDSVTPASAASETASETDTEPSLEGLHPHPVHNQDLVFLQYSSGSTGKPKGVLIDYACALHQIEIMRAVWNSDEKPVTLCWLPLHHNMGIIWGIMDVLCVGGESCFIPTAAFAKNPTLWVTVLSHFRIGMTAGPDSMYRTICQLFADPARRAGLDFSHLRIAVDGAEPLNPSTVEMVRQTFGEHGWKDTTLAPMYGSSEVGVCASGHSGPRRPVYTTYYQEPAAQGSIVPVPSAEAFDPKKHRTLYSVGDNFFGTEAIIVDPQTREVLPECQQGELWFRGVVAGGYYGKPELTAETFAATTAAGDGPYLRTGDLAFLRDGNLYLTGRANCTIIVGGENYFPADIEEIVAESRLGFAASQCCALQSTMDGPWYVLIAEAADYDAADRHDYSALIARTIARRIGKKPDRVLWMDEPLPVTGSGKLARGKVTEIVAELLAEGAGAAGAADGTERSEGVPTVDGTEPAGSEEAARLALLDKVAAMLDTRRDELQLDVDVTQLGFTSMMVNELLGWAAEQDNAIAPEAAWANPTLRGWADLYAQAAQAESTMAATGDSAAENAAAETATADNPTAEPASATGESATSTPTELQKAYLIGSDPSLPWGGVDCLTYSEFTPDFGTLTPTEIHQRLTTAIVLVDQEPALHTAMLDSHSTCFRNRPAPEPELHGGSLEEIRNHYLYRHFNTAQGENWAIGLSFPNGKARLHLAISLICADIVGVGEIIIRLDAALRGDTARALPAAAQHHHTGIAAAARAGVHHPEPATDEQTNQSPLPFPPDLPLMDSGDTTSTPAITRYEHLFTSAQWETLSRAAQHWGTTPAGLALAAYDAVLRRWSSRNDFLVTLTTVQAPAPQIVAERTIAVAHRAHVSLGNTWADTLAGVREDLRRCLAQPTPLGADLRRAIASSTGHSGLSPFIFTYAADQPLLGTAGLPTLGAPACLRSATPQVLIDCQVVNLGDGITLSWDVRTDILRSDVAQQLFDTLVHVLEQHSSQTRGLGSGDNSSGDNSSAGTVSGDSLSSSTVTIDLLPLPAHTQEQRAAGNSTPPLTGPHGGTPELLYQPFLQQVKERPNAVAVVWAPADQPSDHTQGDPLGYHTRGYLTYRELDSMARRLARSLVTRTKKNDIIGVQMPKGPCQVIATLGVLYAGCTYLPISTRQPASRLAAITRSSGMSIVLRRDDMAALIDDEFSGTPMPPCTEAVPRKVDPSELAYIIYTSGSTGTPKGVAIRHYSALNTCLDVNQRNGVTAKDRTLAISALEFDLSVYDIYGMLAAGGTVVCIGDEARRDAFRWAELVQRFHVTIWNTVPGLGEMLYAAAQGSTLCSLRRFYFSGDWIAMDLPKRLRSIAPEATCISMGGATEGSIWSNEFVVEDVDFPADWKSIPYGGPLTGQKYRVVNPDVPGFPDQPDYVPGELWIGGAGVAAGYFGQSELTAERFPVDEHGEHWYRTGDLGEYHTDGLIFFVGRMDTQVKIRGHRVECGEVEHACRSLTGVETAIVVPIRKNSALGAVLITDKTALAEQMSTHPEHLREQLAGKLLDYMIPAVVMTRESLPHTPNGKIDRRLLAQELEEFQRQLAPGNIRTVEQASQAGHAVQAGQAAQNSQASGAKNASSAGADCAANVPAISNADNPFFTLVVDTWATALHMEPAELSALLSTTDPLITTEGSALNFFALGGDSLAATTVCTQLAQAGCQVAVADLFAAPTLPAFLSRARGHFQPEATRLQEQNAREELAEQQFPLTGLQQAYALGADGMRGITCTTPAVSVILSTRDNTPLGVSRLAEIIGTLTAEWEGLRCVRAGDTTQVVRPAAEAPAACTITTLAAEHAGDAQEAQASREVFAQLQKELSGNRIPLGTVPIINLVVVEGDTQYVGLSINYLGLDARSIGVVLTTIMDRYEELNDSLQVEPSARPFYEYVLSEVAAAEASTAPAPNSTSASNLPLPPAPVMPATDNAWTSARDAAFGSLVHRLSASATADLQNAARTAGVTVSAVILQAFGAVIAAHSGLDVCGISVPLSQRPEEATAQSGTREVLGNFTELALCTLGPDTGVAEVHSMLGHLTDGTLPNSRDVARAGRAAYPVVFTSTTGVEALRRAGKLCPAWVLTRTPGVQLDCQVSQIGDTLELRWDYPVDYVHGQRMERLFKSFVKRVEACTLQALTPAPSDNWDSELESLTRELVMGEHPHPRDIMAAALEHLSKHSTYPTHTPRPEPAERYRALVAEWQERAGTLTPSEPARRTGTWLADVLCGLCAPTDIIGHPVLSPQALLLHDPATQIVVEDILTLLEEKYQALGRPISVVELGSGSGLVHEMLEQHLRTREVTVSWQPIEHDSHWRKTAVNHDEQPLGQLSEVPADVVLALGSLHRDVRLQRDLAVVPTLAAAELYVVETTALSDAALVSAAVIEPSLLADPNKVLRDAGNWWMTISQAGWRPTTMSTPTDYHCVIRAQRAEATAPEVCPFGCAGEDGSLPDSPQVREAAQLVMDIWSDILPDTPALSADNPADYQADFFALGGDSLAATRVLQSLKSVGYEDIRLVDLFNTATVGELAELLATLTRTEVTASTTSDTHPLEHPLTGVQQAYLAGRSTAQILGGVASHCYYEFTSLDLNREAFTAAIRAVVDAHDELRALVCTDGGADAARTYARIQPEVPADIVTTVADPRALTESETPDPTTQVGMVVRLSDIDNPVTVSIGMDNLILDGASMMLVLREIDATYQALCAQPVAAGDGSSSVTVEKEALSFGGYLTTHQDALPLENITDPAAAQRVQTARDYWTQHVSDLPPAPAIAACDTVVAVRIPHMDRVAADVTAADWQAAQQRARKAHITPASLVLGAYVEALGEWTGQDAFTVNVTLFDRDLSVPGIERVVGDFTSLTPVACQLPAGKAADTSAGLTTVAQDVQHTLASVRDYDGAGALWVQHELLRLTGDPYSAMLPVVFTCGLGLVGDGVSSTDFSFGTLSRVRSQTSQTLLDLQVHEDMNGLHLTADYVTEAVDAAAVEAAIRGVAERIRAFAEAEAVDDAVDAAVGTEASAAVSTDVSADVRSEAVTTPDFTLAEEELYASIVPIWETALESSALNPDSNFFREGGDSLRATMVTRQVQEATGRDVDLRILLTNPTLADYVHEVLASTASETGTVDELAAVTTDAAGDDDVEEGTL